MEYFELLLKRDGILIAYYITFPYFIVDGIDDRGLL